MMSRSIPYSVVERKECCHCIHKYNEGEIFRCGNPKRKTFPQIVNKLNKKSCPLLRKRKDGK